MKKFIVKLAVGAALVVTLGGTLASAGTPFTADGGAGAGGGLGRHGFARNSATNTTFWSFHPTTRHRPVAIIDRVAHPAPGGLANAGVTRNYIRNHPANVHLSSGIRFN